MKILMWFNVSFSGFIILIGILLCPVELDNWFDDYFCFYTVFVIFSLVTNIGFFLSIRYINKPAYEWIYMAAVSLCSVLTLLYGWYISSKALVKDGVLFDKRHLTILIAALFLSAYLIGRFIWAFTLMKNNTIEDVQFKILQSNDKAIVMPILLTTTPVIFVFFDQTSGGMGLGLCLWSLMCIWLFIFLILMQKVLFILKYKVYKY